MRASDVKLGKCHCGGAGRCCSCSAVAYMRGLVTCSQCDGAGQHWEHWGWGTYDFDAVECKQCGGTGKRETESR